MVSKQYSQRLGIQTGFSKNNDFQDLKVIDKSMNNGGIKLVSSQFVDTINKESNRYHGSRIQVCVWQREEWQSGSQITLVDFENAQFVRRTIFLSETVVTVLQQYTDCNKSSLIKDIKNN